LKAITFTIQASDGQKTVSQYVAGGIPLITDNKYTIQLDGDDPEILYKLILNTCMVYGKITNLDIKELQSQIRDFLKE
jgi:hypothetical protein